MIWRIWLTLMILVVVGAWALMVPYTPSPQSLSASAIGDYRARGLMPKVGGFVLSPEVGHDIFELPAEDAARAGVKPAAGPAMEGMTMTPPAPLTEKGPAAAPPAQPEGGHSMQMTMPAQPEGGHGMQMTMPAQQPPAPPTEKGPAAAPPAQPEGGHSMQMTMPAQPGGGHSMQMTMPAQQPPAPTPKRGETRTPMQGIETPPSPGEPGHGTQRAGISILAIGPAGEVASKVPLNRVSRTVNLAMREWGYGPPRITVRPGEVIRFVISNAGRLPHEFMLMTGAAMAAVDYRLQRADWNLVEHEALAERAVILPGDSFELVARIDATGSWFFMCMFPYHMQLGMMGVLATEGAPSQPMDHGGMKM